MYTIVNFMELYLNLNTQLASQISLNSSISKKNVCFCSFQVAIKIEIAHKHMRMLDVNWLIFLSVCDSEIDLGWWHMFGFG